MKTHQTPTCNTPLPGGHWRAALLGSALMLFGTAQAQYCTPAISSNVEPICNVTFAGINNTTDGAVNGTPEVEDFTAITANVIAGQSYPISFTGNSDGTFTDYFTVFFDWDQDGTLEASEEIGNFYDSECGTVVSGTVSVPFTALAGNTRMRVIKDFNTSPTDPCGTYDYGQVEDYTVSVVLPSCTPPAATASVTPDCANGQFSVSVDLTSLGDAPTVDIVENVNGAGETVVQNDLSGLTTYAMGPYTVGDNVQIRVVHNGDNICDLALGSFTYAQCPTIITCGTPLNETHCYIDNELTAWKYEASSALPLQLTFSAGFIENCCDRLRIFDGTDDTGTILFDSYSAGFSGNDLTNVSVTATSGAIYMDLDSDVSSSCTTGNNPAVWTVSCLACNPPAATATVVPDCGNNSFGVDVDITSFGSGASATINYSVNGTAQTPPIVVSSTGTTNLTGFAFGDDVDVTVAHESDSNCDVVLNNNTLAACAPANDECTDAIALTVNADLNCSSVTSGIIEGATTSGLNPCFGTADDDVWFSFTATATSHQISLINITGSTSDMMMAVYSGTCGSLVNMACSDPETMTASGLTVGNTYYLQVYSYFSDAETTTFDVCVGTLPGAPANDDCAGAVALTVNSDLNCGSVTAASVVSATNSNWGVCNGTADDDVWFSFTATATSHQISLINITGSTGDMMMAVYGGTCGNLVNMDCSDPQTMTASGLTIGETYLLQVYTYTGTSGQSSSFDVCVGTVPAAPANDECAGAVALTVNPDLNCGSVTAGTVAGATNSNLDVCTGTADDDVWYSYTATATSHQISLTNFTGSTSDMVMAVYSGTCGNLVNMACSDPQTMTASGLTVGNTYYLQVYSYFSNAETSTFDVCVGTVPVVPPPANDECAGAIAVTCGSTTPGTTTSATNTDAPTACSLTLNTAPGVWYTAVGSGTAMTAGLCGATWDTKIGIFTGTCGNFTCVASDDDGCDSGTQSEVTWTSTLGATYYIYVTGYSTNSGDFDLSLSCATCLPPAATATVVPACPSGFNLDVDITSFGSGASATINYSVNGTAQTPIPVAATGITTLTGFAGGDNVDITVAHESDNSCDLVLNNNTFNCPPANDDCANAIALTVNPDFNCGSVTAGTVAGATNSGLNPCAGTADDDVWFSFTATATSHQISLINVEYSNGDMVMAVYSGTCGNPVNMGCSDTGSESIPEMIISGLTIGETYLVQVYSYSSGSGQVTSFDVCVGTQPANDDCAGAIAVTCGSTISGTTTGSTNADAPTGCLDNLSTAPGLWYTVEGNGYDITAGLCGSSYDTKIGIFTGSCGNFTCVASDDDGCDIGTQSTVTWTSTASTTYYIYVTGYSTNSGDFDLSVSCGGLCTGDQVVVNINTDSYPGETSWEIRDSGGALITSGAPTTDNSLNSETVCLGSATGGCYTFAIFDGWGDGMLGGGWNLQTTDGQLIMQDVFDDGDQSPSTTPQWSGYGSGHPFCLPLGPANIASTECGIFTNGPGNKVYSTKVTGATLYQFEFSDPDAGYTRRQARPTNRIHFWDLDPYPLTPGVIYFARVRTNVAGPLSEAHFGSGCEMGMSPTVPCTQLISAPNYGHSCNETREFGRYGFIYATPVPGADAYEFRIYNLGEGYDQTFTRSTYILHLKWPASEAPGLANGSTYNVDVNVINGGVESGFCGTTCSITIQNAANFAGQLEQATFGAATLWPNPVHDGQVNLNIDGLVDAEQNITIDIQDIYGKQVYAKEFGNSGDRFSTVLQLPSNIASGVYMVNITVDGNRTVQRLSIIR